MHTNPPDRIITRFRSAAHAAALVLLGIVCLSPASAQTGDFVNAQPQFSSPAGVGVLRGPVNHPTLGTIGANQIGVDRSGDGLLDEIYNIPSEILFNSTGNTIQFRLSPTQDALYTRRFNNNGAPVCAGRTDSNLIYFHRLEVAPATTVLASSVCLDGPISIGPVFMDEPTAEARTAVIAAAPNAASGRQSVAWINLADGGYNVDGAGYRPNVLSSPNGIQFAPDGRAAFIDHGAGSAFRRFTMVDLCRSPVASASATSTGILASGLARGQVLPDGNGGFLAELRLDGTPLPATRIMLDDCSGIQPPTEFNLLVEKSGNGEGRVLSQPSGIDCGADCQYFFNAGTVVSLSAQASFGSSFDGWSGDCSTGNTNTQVTMDADRQCVASFSQPQADIRAVLSTTPLPTTAGLGVTVTLSVVNDGPDTVNASLELPPVDGLNFLSEDSADCSLVQQRVFCSFSGLGAGQSGTVQVQADVEPDARGSLDLTLTASSFLFDPNPANDSITVAVPVVASADLAVQLTGEPDPVPAGETLVYQINVSNAGPSTATDVDVQTTLPQGVSLLDSSATSCNATRIVPGGMSTITLLANVDSGLAVASVLSASAQVNATETDPVGGNNTAMLDVSVGTALPTMPPTPFTRVIGYDDPEPGGTTTLRNFANASWRGETIAFYADNRASVFPDYLQGIYRVRSGRLVTIVNTDTLEPGTTQTFFSLRPVDARINELGQVGFEQYAERGCGLERVLGDPNTAYNVVASQGGHLVLETFNGFMGDALQLWDGTNLQLIADQMTPLPGQTGTPSNGFGLSVALHEQDVAFWSISSSGQGIYLAQPGQSIQVIADENTPIPDSSGTFAGFDQNFDAISMDGSGITFRGYNNQGVAGNVGNRGIYFYDRQTGILEKVADTNTPIPDGIGNFAYFGEAFPSSSTANNPSTENGSVVFFGSDDVSSTLGGGLYLWRDGVISPLVEQGDLIDGLAAQQLSTSSRALSNGRLVFIVARGPTPGMANVQDIYWLQIDNGALFANGFEDQ